MVFAGTTECQLCLTWLESTCCSWRVKTVLTLVWPSDTVEGRPGDSAAGLFCGFPLLAPLSAGAEGAAAQGLVSPLLKFIPESGH